MLRTRAATLGCRSDRSCEKPLKQCVLVRSGHLSPALSVDEADGHAGVRHHRGTVAELLSDMPKVWIVDPEYAHDP